MMLDLQSVRLFVLAAEYGNLTRAAEAAGTVQPVVSARIKALETQIGRRLLDRSPRLVKLTGAGTLFLQHAKALLAAHDAALMTDDADSPSVSLGISDHVLGASLPALLRSLRLGLPARTQLTVRLGTSQDMLERYHSGDVDLAVIRRETASGDGEMLGDDDLDWYGDLPAGYRGDALPLVLLPLPCGVRKAAVAALEAAHLPWREAFTGGSCLALAAAVQAGAGVAPLGRLTARDLPQCSHRSALPRLGASRIVMLARTPDAHHSRAARALAASIRKLLQA